jgi:hypothetical protein
LTVSHCFQPWTFASVAMLTAVSVSLSSPERGPPFAGAQTTSDAAPPSLLAAPHRPISQYVREVFQDRQGNLWFGTNNEGVTRYDGHSLAFFNAGHGLAGNATRGIVEGDDGTLWFATDGGVSRYRDGEFRTYSIADGLSDNETWSILLDRSGSLWVGTQEGVCRLVNDAFVAFPLPRVKVERPESRFTPKVVFAMCQDAAGHLWFGTDGEGLHRYDGRSFTSYATKEGLAGMMVRALCADSKGRIWVGTDGGGVSCIDGAAIRTFTSRDGLHNDRVFEILEDSAGTLWFSTLGAGVCRYDGTRFLSGGPGGPLTFEGVPCACGSGKLTDACHGTGGVHVQDIFEDRDGTLWFGCSGGLVRLDNSSFVHVTRDGPWKPQAASTDAQSPPAALAPFGRMVGGEWRVRFSNDTAQFDRWEWGAGRRSVVSETYGSSGDGQPWRALAVYYWHPGGKEIRVLSAHPSVPMLGHGVATGTATISAEQMRAFMELRQSGSPDRPRRLEVRWDVRHPDAHRTTLLEKGESAYEELVRWEYARSYAMSPLPQIAEAAATPRSSMAPIERLLRHRWMTARDASNPASLQVEASLAWIPYLEAVRARVALAGAASPLGSQVDLYIVRAAGAESFRALVLTASGFVYEGVVTMPDGSTLAFDLTGHERDGIVRRRGDIRFREDGSLRMRAWSDDDAVDAPDIDVRMTPRPAEHP